MNRIGHLAVVILLLAGLLPGVGGTLAQKPGSIRVAPGSAGASASKSVMFVENVSQFDQGAPFRLGGGGHDRAGSVAVDGEDCAYVTGYTPSTNFPATTGASDPRRSTDWDAFATKLHAGGTEVDYATFLRGNDWDRGEVIAVHEMGCAYVTGEGTEGIEIQSVKYPSVGTPGQASVTQAHEGPLILTGTQVYTIENTYFIQHGPIEVHDQATVIIRDSTVEFQQGYHEEFPLWFDGSARLVMERSTIASPYVHMMFFGEGSQAQISDSALPEAFLPLAQAATVTITNTSVLNISPDPVNFGTGPGQVATLNATNAVFDTLALAVTGEATGTVHSLRPGLLADWTLDEVQDAQSAVHLVNTQVESINWAIGGNAHLTFDDCQISQLGVNGNAAVAVRNSQIGQAAMGFDSGQHVTLRGLTSGQTVAHWSLHETDPTTNVPFEYVIDNSRIDGWHIRSSAADLTLEDCDLHGSRLRPESDDLTSTTRVLRTYLDELFLWCSHGTIAFEDSTVHHVANPVDSTTRITGTVRFEQKAIDTAWGSWRQSVITREFPVQVNDANGLPLADGPLQLLDPTGSLAWSGQTGADGGAAFEIVFTDTNYQDTWTLRMGASDPPTDVPVELLSDTPLAAVMQIGLAEGWNLISVRLSPASRVVTDVLSSIEGQYDLAYAYDASDAEDPWKKYNTAAPSFLNDLTEIDETMGFWIRATEPVTLTVSGSVPSSTDISLYTGWNLVGYPSQTTRPVTETLASIEGKYDLVYAYDAWDVEDPWKKYNTAAPPFLNDLTDMRPDWGYWIRVSEDCVWRVEQ